MKFPSMGLRACCVAAVLAGGVLSPAVVFAEIPAAASEADYALFSEIVDKMHFFELTAAALRDASVYNDAAWGLTAGQQEVLASAFYRELMARSPAMLEGMKRTTFALFTHEEVMTLSAVSSRPGAVDFTQAMFAMDMSALGAVENTPFGQQTSESEAQLYMRLFEALMSEQVDPDSVQTAFDMALAEAKSPAGLAAKPTIAPDYNAFRAATQPLRVFDMVSVMVLQELRKSEVMADIPAAKRDAFLAAVEQGLNNRREAVTEGVLREAFKTVNNKDVESLTAISRLPEVPELSNDLVGMAGKLDDVDIFGTLSQNPALANMTAPEFYLMRRYFIIIVRAASVPPDEIVEIFDSANRTVGIKERQK